MKELSKKLIETGVVDRTMAKLFERWGTLPPEEVEQLNQQRVRETLEAFLEEIDLLTQPEAIEKQEMALDPPGVVVDEETCCGQRGCPYCQ